MYLPKIKIKLNHATMEFLHGIINVVSNHESSMGIDAQAKANVSVIQEIAHKFDVSQKRQKEYKVSLKYYQAYVLYYTITILSNQPVSEDHQAYALAQYTHISSLLAPQLL